MGTAAASNTPEAHNSGARTCLIGFQLQLRDLVSGWQPRVFLELPVDCSQQTARYFEQRRPPAEKGSLKEALEGVQPERTQAAHGRRRHCLAATPPDALEGGFWP